MRAPILGSVRVHHVASESRCPAPASHVVHFIGTHRHPEAFRALLDSTRLGCRGLAVQTRMQLVGVRGLGNLQEGSLDLIARRPGAHVEHFPRREGLCPWGHGRGLYCPPCVADCESRVFNAQDVQDQPQAILRSRRKELCSYSSRIYSVEHVTSFAQSSSKQWSQANSLRWWHQQRCARCLLARASPWPAFSQPRGATVWVSLQARSP